VVFYEGIDRETEEGRRTAERLLELREALEREIPERNIAGTLLLATWNIREFDSPSYGDRRDEPLYYIAEIIDHFDLVAIQEVRDNLPALERLMGFLGSWWKYLLTDVTEGTPGTRKRTDPTSDRYHSGCQGTYSCTFPSLLDSLTNSRNTARTSSFWFSSWAVVLLPSHNDSNQSRFRLLTFVLSHSVSLKLRPLIRFCTGNYETSTQH